MFELKLKSLTFIGVSVAFWCRRLSTEIHALTLNELFTARFKYGILGKMHKSTAWLLNTSKYTKAFHMDNFMLLFCPLNCLEMWSLLNI